MALKVIINGARKMISWDQLWANGGPILACALITRRHLRNVLAMYIRK